MLELTAAVRGALKCIRALLEARYANSEGSRFYTTCLVAALAAAQHISTTLLLHSTQCVR
jgi:hypothetical protein